MVFSAEKVKQEPHKKGCPGKENCSTEKRGGSIEPLPHHEVLQRQIRKLFKAGTTEHVPLLHEKIIQYF